jgi:hypothetical protein
MVRCGASSGSDGGRMIRTIAGQMIASRYRLERPLARGGMGSVWIARHVQLGSLAAVKFMDPLYASSAAARERFEREAMAAAQLQSPHVVQVHDYGIEDDTPYIVMELLQGEDLGVRIKRAGRLPFGAVAEMLTQVARALRRAHEAGIVHRDLKPGNIFIVQNDDVEIVKVLDFGIAKAAGLGPSTEMTKTGQLLGSPHYMSPEQARKSKELDHRADLWALAVIAYRALTVEYPFPGDEIAQVLLAICSDPPVPASRHAPELGPAVDRFFERAFAKSPNERFQAAPELAAAFAGARSAATAPRPAVWGHADRTALLQRPEPRAPPELPFAGHKPTEVLATPPPGPRVAPTVVMPPQPAPPGAVAGSPSGAPWAPDLRAKGSTSRAPAEPSLEAHGTLTQAPSTETIASRRRVRTWGSLAGLLLVLALGGVTIARYRVPSRAAASAEPAVEPPAPPLPTSDETARQAPIPDAPAPAAVRAPPAPDPAAPASAGPLSSSYKPAPAKPPGGVPSAKKKNPLDHI